MNQNENDRKSSYRSEEFIKSFKSDDRKISERKISERKISERKISERKMTKNSFEDDFLSTEVPSTNKIFNSEQLQEIQVDTNEYFRKNFFKDLSSLKENNETTKQISNQKSKQFNKDDLTHVQKSFEKDTRKNNKQQTNLLENLNQMGQKDDFVKQVDPDTFNPHAPQDYRTPKEISSTITQKLSTKPIRNFKRSHSQENMFTERARWREGLRQFKEFDPELVRFGGPNDPWLNRQTTTFSRNANEYPVEKCSHFKCTRPHSTDRPFDHKRQYETKMQDRQQNYNNTLHKRNHETVHKCEQKLENKFHQEKNLKTRQNKDDKVMSPHRFEKFYHMNLMEKSQVRPILKQQKDLKFLSNIKKLEPERIIN